MDGGYLNKINGDTVVIWVHGILSSSESCWTNENGNFWPKMVSDELSVKNVSNYVFNYQTTIFSNDYSISDVVDSLNEHMEIDNLFEYSNIIFVCHSMGGIVVRKLIVDKITSFIEKGSRIGLFLLASPSLGADYASFFNPIAKIMRHTQADSLKFIKNNIWLFELNKNFLNIKEGNSVQIFGKELVEDKFVVFHKFIFMKQVVPPISGNVFFGKSIKISNSDHFSISKPEDDEALQHKLLIKFITENNISKSEKLKTNRPVGKNINTGDVNTKGGDFNIGDVGQSIDTAYKNINTGNVNTKGGDFNIGDKI